MPQRPNKLSQFWQELKRRRVVHVITVYASAAFVIIELINNLAEPLNLPTNLLTIVVIVLAVGFPLAIILSWLYDLTSEGIEKTKPLSEIHEKEKPVVPNAWKIATYVSFVVIAGLAVLNIVGGSNPLRTGDIQSIVILPFENFTGDDQLEWFVSAMHASLINDMGRISGLRVIGKTSSDVYKNTDMSASEIASKLDVDAVMEAQVVYLGDSIRTLFNLIQVSPEEKQVLTGDIKEGKRQIQSLYNEITKQISDKVMLELTANEELLLAESREVDPDALDAYYKGLFYNDMLNKNSLQKANDYFLTAIEIEPDWARPYAGLAGVAASQMQMGFNSPSVAIPKIYENLNRALELDPNFSNSHHIKAIIAVWTEWNWEKGEEEFLKAIQLNPNYARSRIFYAHLLNILHRPDEAIYQANLALKLEPQEAKVLGLYSALMGHMGDYQSAIDYAEKALSIDPTHRFAIMSISGAYRKIGDYEKFLKYFKKLGSYDNKVLASIDSVFQEQGYFAAVEMTIKIDEEAAKERYIDNVLLGFRYLEIYQYDKAMDCYEKGYEFHNPNMPYITTKMYGSDQLKDNPRYIELLKKMNLPIN